MADRPIPVYNEDGTTFGHIDEPEDGPGLSGDYHRNPDQPYRSIWDDDNPADDYKYRKPDRVQQNRPQGFWGNGGNPNWGTPTPGQRWGDDPTGGFDPRSGQPDSAGGSVRYFGPVPEAKRKVRRLKRRFFWR